uniref:3'-phosphate/5'-hydroxy nucleic acid ligase n=1 Tax=Chromera velia CCMP2878 TaxID=1169474 RepID=A0A0G4FSQ0_9ALVE|eukprot:Cvel_18579.t1-p1 / transcript=Cvel_18579.t1 / gene=Cvel_18579 / organism=Chromera_velia_CCMP2878 / gene_product=RNA-splicing ligase RtcB, putative / transcript_product=RNA-splicing ligase RtcB, putative / location=Cvel_scaffold1549:16143-22126(+) / protein_length=486 / sequence_SO=supercontig / SO=protein_coding / is_pseudo=false
MWRLRSSFVGPHSLRCRFGLSSSGGSRCLYGTQSKGGRVKSYPIRINTENVPVYLYTDDADTQTMQQLRKLAEKEFVVGFVAGMPDVHLGKGATVGSVFATRDAICPNAVGVDIGCGMCAVPLEGLTRDDADEETLLSIHRRVKDRIPTGFDYHSSPLPGASNAVKKLFDTWKPTGWLRSFWADRHTCQVGTLGGGNHFIELLYDENGGLWLMLHSGSRHIGNCTAQHYDELAARQTGGQKEGLSFLYLSSREGQDYVTDMNFCQAYAAENRHFMMDAFAEVALEEFRQKKKKRGISMVPFGQGEEGRGSRRRRAPGVSGGIGDRSSSRETEEGDVGARWDAMVNIHHNYCQCEKCRWRDEESGQWREEELWVTRKGATSAKEGELGIIPGSMGTGSFIVRGKGSSQSWQSCSHGAGRRMSRKAAMRMIAQRDFVESMKGIVCDTHGKVRDEAPQAYKDLKEVMSNQSDLVDVVHRLLPLMNVKGF